MPVEEGGVEEGGMEEGRGWWGTRERLDALQCVDNSRLHQTAGNIILKVTVGGQTTKT